MANNRFNNQIQTITEPQSGGQGARPKKGEPQKSSLPMGTARYPGLPGKAGPDRAAGMPEAKIYASAQGIRGSRSSDKF